ncbi:MAG: hypothetical protein ACP5HU_08135 [Phycisphaerae bacterium]
MSESKRTRRRRRLRSSAVAAEAGLPATPPKTPAQLAHLVRECFDLNVPSRALCEGHNSPLDYLVASFFCERDLLVWANRGGGKTMMAAVATLLDAVYHGPVHIRVIGGSFEQSNRLAEHIRELLERRPELLVKPPTRDRVQLTGGSEIRMLPQSERAVRGQHVQKIRCDEVELFDERVWRAVQFATRSTAVARGSIEVLSTLHRSGGLMHRLVSDAKRLPSPAKTDAGGASRGYALLQWCLWDVIQRCPKRRRCEDCPLADDCKGVARRGEGFFRIDDAIAIKARSSRAAWDAEMLCKGPHREWLVFPEFDLARHVRPAGFCRDWPLYRAIDFGYRSPLVCLWLQVSPAGAVHVIDEYVRRRLPLTAHADEILRRDPPDAKVAMTYVDPAGRQKEATSGAACTELLRAAGIASTCRSSTIAEGLELIRAALAPACGDASLVIDPRCKRLIDAFGSYHYPPPGSAGDSEKPAKDGPDHLIDALRYFFVNRMRPNIAVRRGRY